MALIDKHLPNGHPLHSICNRSTLKVSYRCLPNVGRVISKHNSKILNKTATTNPKPKPNCNCRSSRKGDCPMPGECNTDGVVYQAEVTTRGHTETYVGLAANFKKRYYTHFKCLQEENSDRHTCLTRYYWKKINEGETPTVKWKYLERNVPIFNHITRKCRLCLREKFNIVLKSNLATLNSRHEIFTHCRHMQGQLIGEPPD